MKNKIIKSVASFMAVWMIPLSASSFGQEAVPQSYIQNESPSSLVLTEKEYNNYILGPGDSISVHLIVGDNALSNNYNFLIAGDGQIFFPNIGPIKISGLSVKNAEAKFYKEIEKKFKEPFKLYLVLKQPRMLKVFLGADAYIPSLEILEKYVFVYGEVSRAGRYTFFPSKKLSDYLNISGGPTGRSDLTKVTVTRNIEGKPMVFRVDASEILYKGYKQYDMAIYEGDVISVPANFFYFTDFASFANTILLGITLFATVSNYFKK